MRKPHTIILLIIGYDQFFLHPKNFKLDVRNLLGTHQHLLKIIIGPRYEAMIEKGVLDFDRVKQTFVVSVNKVHKRELMTIAQEKAKNKVHFSSFIFLKRLYPRSRVASPQTEMKEEFLTQAEM